MFKSFKDVLQDIEKLYDAKDYNATILESAKLTENALRIFFNHFHTLLNTKEDWQKYLEFEREAGDKFAGFLKKPTIGVAIAYYNTLVRLFPNYPGINNEIRQYLNTVNSIRNEHLHANQKEATGEEAGRVLDSLEDILTKTNLIKASTTVIGVPIKYYLVFTSIKEKFETAESESDFKKIVDDSLKITPSLLNILLNKVYHSLSNEMKAELVDLFIASVDEKGDNELKYYLNLCKAVDLERIVDQGVSLRESLQALGNEQAENSRRQTRHYVNILEIIINYSNNSETKHFLEFADAVKKKYLVRHKLTDKDRIILDEKAKDLKISVDLAERIEESVISTIEKELILFKTLTYNKLDVETTQPPVSKQQGFNRKRAAVYAIVLIASVAASFLWANRTPEKFNAFERAYFESRFEEAEELSKEARSLSDLKAHFYYIISVYRNNVIFPVEVKSEYRKLLKDNPNSPEAHFYLASALWYGTTLAEENDSAWVLLDYARKNGIKGYEIEYVDKDYFHDLRLTNQELELSNRLTTYGYPTGLASHARDQLAIKYDTAQATALFKAAIEIYPRFVSGYISLASISIKNRDYATARELLVKAKEINPKSSDVISRLASLSKDEGKFDEAKLLYREALGSFGADTKDLHYGLLQILLQEDSVQIGLALINQYLVKFPKDMVLLNFQGQFNRRERWLKEESELSKSKNSVAWLSSYDEALKVSAKEKKPVLIDFYTSWCYWCKVLDKKVYPDSSVQANLRKFVLVKINAERDTKLANKYEVNAYPTLLVVENEGKKLFQLMKYVSPAEINGSLNEGLQSYTKYSEGKNITKETFTRVTNLNDAKIISKSKSVPIMLLVGDKRSTWSERLVTKTIEDPAFKNEFTQIIYLPIDKLEAPEYLKNYNITSYPSILFLDEQGKEYFRISGYQPSKVLQEKVNLAKSSYKKEKLSAGINWYYDLDEARSLALISKKNIFVAGFDPQCDPCNWMEKGTFKEREIIDLLSENYVCLHLENKVDKELVSKLGIESFPAQMILKESGEEMFSSSGYKSQAELKTWLDIDKKVELLSILGSERFETFNEDQALSKALLTMGCYQSALDILVPQTDLLPDYYELHLSAAQCLNGLRRYDESIESYQNAISKGAPLTENLFDAILTNFISLHRLNEVEPWLETNVPVAKKDDKIKAVMNWTASRAYQLAGDQPSALQSAKNSMLADPNFHKGHLQYGRLLYYEKSYDQAEKVLQKANTLDKQDPVACLYLGLIAKKSSKLAEKSRYYNEATNRSSWAANQVSYSYLAYIPNYFQYPEAITMLLEGCDHSLELQRDSSYPYFLKSLHLLLYKKDPESALRSIEKAAEVDPEDVMIGFCKALVLFEAGKKAEAHKAIEVSNELLADNDNFPLSDYALGLYYLDKDDKEMAMFHFRRCSTYNHYVAWLQPIQAMAAEKLTAI